MTPNLRWGLASDVGRIRKENQDRSVATGQLFAVADGMGGHAGGATAAQVAVETLRTTFEASPSAGGLHDAIRAANAAILERAAEDRSLHGMGTTLTALALVDNGDGSELLHLANVGDSRAYLLRGGDLFQLTEDHSMVEEMVRAGELSADEAASHPARHVLTRVLGVDPDVTPDAWEIELRDGDRILLCSDGLVNEVDDDSIAAILQAETDPDGAARTLVETARANGGSDNITVIVVDIGPGSSDLHATLAGGAREADESRAREEGAGSPSLDPGGPPPPSTNHGPGEVGLAGAALGDAAELVTDKPGPGEEGPGEWHTSVPGPSGGSSWMPGPDDGDLASASPGTAGATGPDADPVLPGVAPGPAERLEPGPSPRWDTGAAMALVGAGGGGGNLFVPAPDPVPGQARRSGRHRAHRESARLPRRILTVRTLAFVLLLLLVVAGAVASVEIYAARSWFVTVRGTNLVVEQGQPGGVLWIRPKTVEVSGITTAHVEPYHLAKLRAGIPVANLAAANQLLTDLRAEYQSLHPAPTGSAPAGTGSASTTPASGSAAGGSTTTTTTSGTASGSSSSSNSGASAGSTPSATDAAGPGSTSTATPGGG